MGLKRSLRLILNDNRNFCGLMISLHIRKFKSILCVYVMFHGNYEYQCKIHNYYSIIGFDDDYALVMAYDQNNSWPAQDGTSV